jgi:hypothetical protein
MTTHDRVNEVLTRVFALDEAAKNVRAFRCLLEALHECDLSLATGKQVHAIRAARAAILRATISGAMAILDAPGGDRNSVGQVIKMLGASDVPEYLSQHPLAGVRPLDAPTLSDVKQEYDAFRAGDTYRAVRALRDNKIAHDLALTTPTVEYAMTYEVHDMAEKFVTELHRICGRHPPDFLEREVLSMEYARLFWRTYFDGMTRGT